LHIYIFPVNSISNKVFYISLLHISTYITIHCRGNNLYRTLRDNAVLGWKPAFIDRPHTLDKPVVIIALISTSIKAYINQATALSDQRKTYKFRELDTE
jgi:hypothetical protein